MADKEVKVKITADISSFQKTLKSLLKDLENIGNVGSSEFSRGISAMTDQLNGASEAMGNTASSAKNVGSAAKKTGGFFLNTATNVGLFSAATLASLTAVSQLAPKIKDMVARLKENKTVTKSSLDVMGSQVEQLNETMNKLSQTRKELDQYTEEINKLIEGYSVGAISQEKFNEEIGRLTTESNKAQGAIEKYTQEMDNMLEAARKTSEETEKFIRKNEKLESTLESTVDEYNKHAEALRKVGISIDDIDLQSLMEDMKKSATIVDVFASAMEKAKTAASNLGNDIKSSVSKATKELEEMKQKSKQVESTMDDLSGSTDDLSQSQKKLDNSANDLFGNYSKLAQKISDYASKIDQARGRNTEFTSALKKMSSAIESVHTATSKVKNLKETMTDLGTKAKAAANSIKDFASGLKNSAIDGAKNKIESLKKEIKSLADAAKEAGEEMKSGFKDAFSDLMNGDFKGAFEKISDPLKNLASSFPGLSSAATVITGISTALYKLYNMGKQQFFTGLTNAVSKLQPVINAFQSLGREVMSAFESMTGFDLDLSSLLQVGPEFEAQMARVGAIAGANDQELAKLTETARKWGATTRYSGTEAAQAMEYLAQAGWSVQDIMDGIGGTLDLATVSGMSLAESASFVADALTALGMHASQANDMVDMLAATSVRSNTSVAQMQGAFENVAPIAGTLGISMSDLSVAIGLMANQGVKAEKAGTALKNLLTNMSAPTEKMLECINKYNLGTAQTLIQNGQLVDGIIEMQKQLEGLTAAEKTAVITTIAGKEALSGVAAIMNSSYNDIMSLKFAVDSSTKSGKMYAQSLGLIDEAGNVLIKDFNNMTEAQQKAYSQWENFNKVLGETTDVMTLVGGSTTDLGAIIQKLGEDGEVTTEQVNGILDFFDKVNVKSKESADALKEYGIEVKYADDGSIDFGETLKSVGGSWDKLNDSQKQQLATMLGYKGELGQLDELFANNGETIEELIDAYERCESVSEHMADTFDATLKGSVLNLASAMEEQLLQVFDKVKEKVQIGIEALTEFFDIWNGLSEAHPDLSGFGDAIGWLAEQSKSFGEAIKSAVVNAIGGLNDFVNGGSLDSILEIGTNIITGICDGINEAKENGTLDDAINGAITKICDWITQNGPQIEKAGKTIIDSITDGIKNNEKAIGDALDTVCSVIGSWADSSSVLKGELSKFADTFAKLAVDSIGRAIKEKFKDVWHSLFDFGDLSDPESGGIFTSTNIVDLLFGKDWDPIGDIKKWLDDRLSGFSLYRELKERILNNKTTSKGQDAGTEPIKISDLFGDWHPIEDLKKWIEEKCKGFNIGQFIKQCILGTTSHGGSTSLPATTAMISPPDIFGDWDPIGDIKKWIEDKFGNFNLIQTIKDQLKKGGTTSKGADSGSEPVKISDLFGNWNPIEKIKEWIKSKFGNFNLIQTIKDTLFKKGGGTGGGAVGATTAMITPTDIFGDWDPIGKIKEWLDSKFKGFNFKDYIKKLLLGSTGAVGGAVGAIGGAVMKISDIFGDWNPIEEAKQWLDEKIGDWSITKWFKEKMGGGENGEGTKVDPGELLQIDTEKLGAIEEQLNSLSTTATTVASNLSTAFTSVTDGARTAFQGLYNIANNQMMNITTAITTNATSWFNVINNQVLNARNAFTTQFISMANVARTQMVNVSNIIRNQAVAWSNIISNQVLNARNAFTQQFMSMAAVARTQMVNVSNIVRNQAISWSNVIRNQVTNARNALTSQFLSMASVARTQMVNISNIVRNQATSWSNIIRNQVTNARNALTSQMLSMASVTRTQMVNISNIVRNQMVNCTNIIRNQGSNMASALTSSMSRMSSAAASSMARVVSTVRSYISQIKAMCSQTFTMNFKANISKTVTTTNVTKNVTKSLAALMRATNSMMSLGISQGSLMSGGMALSSGGGGGYINNGYGELSLEVPLYLDGREIARASAKYNEKELSKLNKRNSRKRGE